VIECASMRAGSKRPGGAVVTGPLEFRFLDAE
jgi:hypothetical protein